MQIEKEEYKTVKRKERFAFWFVFSLILNGYATGIPGISLGSAIYIILVIVTILNGIKPGNTLVGNFIVLSFGAVLTASSFFGMVVFFVLNSSLSLPINSHLIGIAKFWLWVLMSSVVVRNYYDKRILTKWMSKFALILTIYIVLQSIAFYSFRVYLPNIFNVGFLKPYDEGYANYEILSNTGLLRPASFLSESSFYGNFILCTTVLYLEEKIYCIKTKEIIFVLFLSFGIVLSGSTSAIIFQAFALFVFFRKIKSSLKWQIGLFAILLVVIIATAWVSGLSDSFIGSTLNYSFDKFSRLETSSRVGKSYRYLTLVPATIKMIGAGLGIDSYLIRYYTGLNQVYLNSLTSLVIQSGYLGCILFGLFGIKLFVIAWSQRNIVALVLIITYFVKGFASGIYFSTYGVLLMFIIIGQIEANNKASISN